MKPTNPLFRTLPAMALGAAMTAQTWTEVDARELPATAELTVGNGPLQRIDGALSVNTDVDMYLIRVDDPATFRCTTVGGATWDTTLWMFGRDGRGIAFHEDGSGHVQSTLTGQFLSGPGYVLIAISAWDNDPLDAANQELWQDSPWQTERQPDGPGAANPVDHWDQRTGVAVGSYSISLSGVSFARQDPAPQPEVAWARIVPPSGFGVIQPEPAYRHAPPGTEITAAQFSPGLVVVSFLGMAANGVAHVSAYGGNHSVVVRSLTQTPGPQAIVSIYGPGGLPAALPFCIHYRVGGRNEERTAYLWADNPTAASYTPSATSMWNGTRGNATIARQGTGDYLVSIPGLGTSLSGELGNVQVSPYRPGSDVAVRRAKVESWTHAGSALEVRVRTFGGGGAPVDCMFFLSYQEKAAAIGGDQGSGAHVLSDATVAQMPVTAYLADPRYADSNGTLAPGNGEVIWHYLPGNYGVILPNVVAADSATAQVTAYGSGSEYAIIQDWFNLGNSTHVSVHTFAANGAPADCRFSLSYLTNRQSRNAATNSVVGLGCHGPVLRALSRPIAGTNWTFDLIGLPANSLLGFIQLGLTNPNLPLGFAGAPECVRLQDVLATHLLFLPIGHPSYTLPISTNPAFLGLNIYVQGGSLAPGVNALGLAASNGIHGVQGIY